MQKGQDTVKYLYFLSFAETILKLQLQAVF